MAYNEDLAQRIRQHLLNQPGLVEKKMFGGIGFMVHGNLACGVNQDELIVRVGPDRYPEIIMRPHVRPFDMTGRPMKGWVLVSAAGIADEEALTDWLKQGVDFAMSLPPK